MRLIEVSALSAVALFTCQILVAALPWSYRWSSSRAENYYVEKWDETNEDCSWPPR
jgi:hypothetical protein